MHQVLGITTISFIILELRASSSPTEYSICQGDSITVGTSVYTTTGQYVDSMLSVSGCDSLVLTNLTVNPVVNYQIIKQYA